MKTIIKTEEVKIEFKTDEPVTSGEFYRAIKWVLQEADGLGLREEVSQAVFSLISIHCQKEIAAAKLLIATDANTNDLSLDGLFLQSLPLRFEPLFPCGLVGEKGGLCGKPASGGTAVLLDGGKWSILPICRDCAVKFCQLYLKQGANYDQNSEEINETQTRITTV